MVSWEQLPPGIQSNGLQLGSYRQIYQRPALGLSKKGAYCTTRALYSRYSGPLLSVLHSALGSRVSGEPGPMLKKNHTNKE